MLGLIWFSSNYKWKITRREKKTPKFEVRVLRRSAWPSERALKEGGEGYLQSRVTCQPGRLVVDWDDSHCDGEGDAPAFDLISGGRECEAVLRAFCAVMHVVDVSKFHLERKKKKILLVIQALLLISWKVRQKFWDISLWRRAHFHLGLMHH